MLSRESILNVKVELPREEVDIREWNGSIFVRVLTAAERDQLELDWEATKRKNFRARLVLAAACDAEGKQLFRAQDLLALGNQSAAALGRICDVAFRLNKFTKEDVADLEKNSESGPSDGSS